jgi:hypothetical protein
VIERHAVGALVLKSEMLERLLELPEATLAVYRTGSVGVIAIRDPTLPSELAMPAMERFGDVLYSLYGPTVVQLDHYWQSGRVRDRPSGAGSI